MTIQKQYRACPYDPNTWYSISCNECLYAIYSDNGDKIIGCCNYDEWNDEKESLNDVLERQSIEKDYESMSPAERGEHLTEVLNGDGYYDNYGNFHSYT